jgi:(2R)-ethylmalonyl-CoA mutase
MTDAAWIMRTYSGHSSARESNCLYRKNLEKGQTGLSVAFDLPTQTGFDPDAPESAGEVGKVGVPVAHLGHMHELLDGIPLDRMNTSMTINATAAWLLALYVTEAENRGLDPAALTGTVQNDIIKEYLSRGTYIFGPAPSRRLTVDTIAWTLKNAPRWNPINVCSYHLQEAGATPEQELAFSLANAVSVLDAVKASGQVSSGDIPKLVGRISFFCNSGIRFVEEVCKMRAFASMWDRICEQRYGVTDPRMRRFRYGVQVNSLGLTEQQPENNLTRIVLETLGVTLSKDARARAIQLPAWNEALGLPRPWDQQWSLRIQQILAYETDLLEHEDIFAGSHVVEELTAELVRKARAELEEILDMGGSFEAIEELKARLVRSQSERARRIEAAEQVVVGVNSFTNSEISPLIADESVFRVDPAVEAALVDDVVRWRSRRDVAAVKQAVDLLRASAEGSDNLMDATLQLARAGGTTGEWAGALRDVWGSYTAPTGLSGGFGIRSGDLSAVRERVRILSQAHGGPPRLLVAKPGLDGHSNGAEQIAVAARDAGFEVIYQGIRQSCAQIVATARDENVDVVGLSILSGSHVELVSELLRALRAEGVEVPVVVGGIIPPADQATLRSLGVSAVYTPKDYRLSEIMSDLAGLLEGQLP